MHCLSPSFFVEILRYVHMRVKLHTKLSKETMVENVGFTDINCTLKEKPA